VGYRFARKLNDIGVISDDVMERVRRNRGSADYRAARGVMREILVKVVNEEYREELGSLRRLSLIWGANDSEVPVDVAEESARIVEAGGGVTTIEVVAGVGHLLPIQSPDSLRLAVERLSG
jgi:pimeloyl-ACP methyl ester carboxylesterase